MHILENRCVQLPELTKSNIFWLSTNQLKSFPNQSNTSFDCNVLYTERDNEGQQLFKTYSTYQEDSEDSNEFLLPTKSIEQFNLERTMKVQLIKAKLHYKWNLRYKYFSKFDFGIKLDVESWYSVTPERIAVQQAERCRRLDLIVDPFCGCGGNVIQFAKRVPFVITGDIDPEKIKLAVNNSEIYGVRQKICFIVADASYLLECFKGDTAFLSPPWGGPDYIKKPQYSLETDMTPNIYNLYGSLNTSFYCVILYVPRTSVLEPLQILAKKRFKGKYMVEKNSLDNKIVAITVYMGRYRND